MEKLLTLRTGLEITTEARIVANKVTSELWQSKRINKALHTLTVISPNI
jgi:hypothetical protein